MSDSSKYRGCNYCKHFHVDGSCPAFEPAPIPIDIVSGQTKHTVPILGQTNSIVYEYCEKSIFQRLLDLEENKVLQT